MLCRLLSEVLQATVFQRKAKSGMIKIIFFLSNSQFTTLSSKNDFFKREKRQLKFS